MKFAFVCLVFAMGTAGIAASPAVAVAQDSNEAGTAGELNSAQRLAAAILAAVRANNERIEGVELSVTRDFQDRSVKEVEQVREALPNGGAIVTTRRPAAHIVERAVVLEDRVRFETGGTDQYPSVTYWFDGVRWTRVDGNGGRVSKMRPDQLGGRIYDPREVVGIDPRTSLVNVLAPSALENATIETNGTVSTIQTESAGCRVSMSFDSAVGLLPTKAQWFRPEGGLIRDAVMRYGLVAERGGWIIEEMVEHYYDLSGNPAQAPAEWKQEMRTAVACRPLARADAEKELVAVIPAGNPAVDFTDGAASVRKPKATTVRPVSRTDSALKWFIGAHVIVLAGGAAVYLWRRPVAARA